MLRIAEEDISKGLILYTWFLQWNIGTTAEKENGKSKLIEKIFQIAHNSTVKVAIKAKMRLAYH